MSGTRYTIELRNPILDASCDSLINLRARWVSSLNKCKTFLKEIDEIIVRLDEMDAQIDAYPQTHRWLCQHDERLPRKARLAAGYEYACDSLIPTRQEERRKQVLRIRFDAERSRRKTMKTIEDLNAFANEIDDLDSEIEATVQAYIDSGWYTSIEIS